MEEGGGGKLPARMIHYITSGLPAFFFFFLMPRVDLYPNDHEPKAEWLFDGIYCDSRFLLA